MDLRKGLLLGFLLSTVLGWGITTDEAHQYLRQKGYDNFTTTYTVFARWNNHLVIDSFLAIGRDINETNEYGRTCLMESILSNNTSMFMFLLSKNPNVNIIDSTGQSALMLVSSSNKEKSQIIQSLLDRGAKVNFQDIKGQTVLHNFCNSTEFSIREIEAVIAKGADVNQADKAGVTPLMLAARRSNPDRIKVLLSHSAKINQQDLGGNSALIYSSDNLENYKYIINAGIDPFAKNTSGNNMAMILASRIDPDTLEKMDMLIQKGLPVNERNLQERTALMNAAAYGNIPVLQYLLYQGAAVDLQDYKGNTALMIAAQYQHNNAVQALLQNKANVDLQDKEGNTALIKAVGVTKGTRDNTIVKQLLKSQADYRIKNAKGETALKAAIYAKNSDFVQLLWEAGAKE